MLACTACRHLGWRRELLEDWAATAQAQGMRVFANRSMRWLVGPRSLVLVPTTAMPLPSAVADGTMAS